MKKDEVLFHFGGYQFRKIQLDVTSFNSNHELSGDLSPSGFFQRSEKEYTLNLIFEAKYDSQIFVSVECSAVFVFAKDIAFDGIPEYFYSNSIAILYPYIRAMISTLTLQANIPPLILPIKNLASMGKILKEHTECS